MIIRTTRFGAIDVDHERILSFQDGLLGFPERKRFALIETSTDPVFFWMQSVDEPALAFVVCDPAAFLPDYAVPIRKEDLAALGAARIDACQVLVIVNKVDGDLTANLLGPLVISATTRSGRQLVLSDRQYGTRHPLMRASAPAAAIARTA